MRHNGGITFVSPVRKIAARTHVFYLTQPGLTEPLKLEYPTRVLACGARAQIMRSGNTHAVPTMKLFEALCQAFAAHTSTPETTETIETD